MPRVPVTTSRREQILTEALEHIAHQLALVQRRRDKLDALQTELEDKRAQLRMRLLELEHAGR